MTLARRTLLQGLGLSAAAGLAPSVLSPRRAHAATAPRFLGIFYTEHGVVPKNFYFTRGTLPASAPWQFQMDDMAQTDFSQGMRPLWRHRKKMIVVQGMAHIVAAQGAGDDHGRGMVAALTGSAAPTAIDGARSNAGWASVDQIVAADLRKKDPSLTSQVVLNMRTDAESFPFHHTIWAQTGAQPTDVSKVPYRGDYGKIHSDLFGNLKPMTADPISSNQKRVLDLASAEYDRIGKLASSEDKNRLDQHRQLLGDLERRLTALPPAANCTAPAQKNPGDYKTNVDVMTQLAVAAWNCRINRVAYLHCSTVLASMVGGQGDFHQDYAHKWNTSAEAERGCSMADQLNAEWFAKWADQLDAIPNGTGGTLLDDSCLVWTGELANGGHGHAPTHFTILGGGGGMFKTGRYIYFPGSTMAHNHALVSLAQMMGVDTNQVGAATASGRPATGPLMELVG